jgi:hypothetical protein
MVMRADGREGGWCPTQTPGPRKTPCHLSGNTPVAVVAGTADAQTARRTPGAGPQPSNSRSVGRHRSQGRPTGHPEGPPRLACRGAVFGQHERGGPPHEADAGHPGGDRGREGPREAVPC